MVTDGRLTTLHTLQTRGKRQPFHVFMYIPLYNICVKNLLSQSNVKITDYYYTSLNHISNRMTYTRFEQ